MYVYIIDESHSIHIVYEDLVLEVIALKTVTV